MIGRRDLFFFAPALLLSIFTPLFLPFSSVSLSYSILSVPIRECLGKHSCMSPPFPIAVLNAIPYFFARRNSPCLGRNFGYQNLITVLFLIYYTDYWIIRCGIICNIELFALLNYLHYWIIYTIELFTGHIILSMCMRSVDHIETHFILQSCSTYICIL